MGVASAIGAQRGAAKASRKIRDVKRSASKQFGKAFEEVQPFRQAAREQLGQFGTEDPAAALNQLRAISGSLGPEAQAQAFQAFQDSPGTAFLRERGLRGVDRRAAAGGGLGSGRRLEALTQFSQGLALQDLQRQLGVLGGVETRERDLLGQRLGLEQQEAADVLGFRQNLANVELSTAGASAQIAAQKGAATGNIIGGVGQDLALAGGLLAGSGLFGGAAPTGPPGGGFSFDTANPFGSVNLGFGSSATAPLSFDPKNPFG